MKRLKVNCLKVEKMIKISKSMNEIDNKLLLLLLSDSKTSESIDNHKPNEKYLKTKISEKEDFDDVFEKILSLDEFNCNSIENERIEVDSVKSKYEKADEAKVMKNEDFKCINLNKECSKCSKAFENYEHYYRIRNNNGEEININFECFQCNFCEEQIEDFYVLENENQFVFYHPNCYFKQKFNLLCFVCRSEIIKQNYFIIDNLTYHLDCVKCYKCSQNFKLDSTVVKFLSKFYCFKCVDYKLTA